MNAISSKFIPGEVIVRTRNGFSFDNENVSSKYGATIVDSFEIPSTQPSSVGGQLLQLKLPAGLTTEAAIEQMKQDPSIAYAEPNIIIELDKSEVGRPVSSSKSRVAGDGSLPQNIPNDLTPDLWGMHNTGQKGGKADADIDAPEAWAVHTGRNDAPIIAVIDTGVDYNHADLKDNMWVNKGEIPGNGIDDDGNGVIDDVHGYNAFADNGNPMDGHGHGTHCAGTIAGVGNNGDGVVGVNQHAQVMAVKIFDDGGATNEAAILRAISYATKMGARITSNSWGGNQASEAIKEAFLASPALHIMAAGNNYTNNDLIPNYPSNYEMDHNIAVAASDNKDKKASFSCYGKKTVDIAAPGVDILSCKPGGGLQMMSGTSMATPHVAGVAGLVASAYPEATNEELKQRILQGADKVAGWESKVATGARLNAYGALTVQLQSA